jgi:hypothetical protein
MNKDMDTQFPPTDQTPAPAKKSRHWLWLILGFVLVLALAAAAFLGGRYLQNGPGAIGGGMFLSSNGSGSQAVQHIFNKNDIIPAPQLPQTAADVTGVFLRRQNNSFFIGTGHVALQVKGNGPNGKAQVGSSYDGPVVEVVTTPDTKIYKDVTDLDNAPSNTKVQQKVVRGSPNEIGQTSMIDAWGKKTGDRLVANVLLYNNQ